jgi:hypothetical protein
MKKLGLLHSSLWTEEFQAHSTSLSDNVVIDFKNHLIYSPPTTDPNIPQQN